MNNFFNAFLLLFFITSCAVSVSSISYKEVSENHRYDYAKKAKKVKKYEDMQAKYRVEALNLTTREKVFQGRNYNGDIKDSILSYCVNVHNSPVRKNKCVLSRYQDEIYHMDFYSYRRSDERKAYLEEQKIIAVELEKEKKLQKKLQKEIILAGLLSRCENFGWKSDDDLASCVQQEAYRDLQLEKQKRQIKILEQKIELAQIKSVDDEPLFFMILDAYNQSKQLDNINLIKKDIAMLKSSNAYKGSSTEAALESLYKTNN